MSGAAETEADVCCANCGIAEVDDVKLEECDGCDLVKYCGDKCREDHREQHEEECKNRKALLHDRKLFTQPEETHLGECPLCFLQLPLDPEKSAFYQCCSNYICDGCIYANYKSNKNEARKCPFCRTPSVTDKEVINKRVMKRVKANDPAAMIYLGGELIQQGDYDGAFQYYTKAAELGNVDAHYRLGFMYYKGICGVDEDEEKAVYHWEKAAIGGDPQARHNLAAIEEEIGNTQSSVKHLIIAANLGYERSIKSLWKHYSAGNITKEDLDATLRSHQAALDAMKSEQRNAADVALQGFRETKKSSHRDIMEAIFQNRS
jgi:tetratricopeptide (TPR) repeat protein